MLILLVLVDFINDSSWAFVFLFLKNLLLLLLLLSLLQLKLGQHGFELGGSTFFSFFFAAPVACGSSRARGPTGATAVTMLDH